MPLPVGTTSGRATGTGAGTGAVVVGDAAVVTGATFAGATGAGATIGATGATGATRATFDRWPGVDAVATATWADPSSARTPTTMMTAAMSTAPTRRSQAGLDMSVHDEAALLRATRAGESAETRYPSHRRPPAPRRMSVPAPSARCNNRPPISQEFFARPVGTRPPGTMICT